MGDAPGGDPVAPVGLTTSTDGGQPQPSSASSANAAVSVQAVSKCYRLYTRPRHRLLEVATLGRLALHRTFWALRGVTFDVPRGVATGIVGRNGAGKSTLLQIIAGTMAPTSGRVLVSGRTSALLELGAGFNGDFTGRENVRLNAVLMGLDAETIEERYDAIAAFADIGTFIDQPVKTYSSGMVVRLAFAVAVHVDPDVLIVDEALAVGDILFQHKCIRWMQEFIRAGRTVLFTSHNVETVKMLCERAVLLNAGEIVEIGEPDRVARAYQRLLFRHEAASLPAGDAPRSTVPGRRPSRPPSGPEPVCVFRHDPSFVERVEATRFGDGRARIVNVELRDLSGAAVSRIEFGQEVVIDVHIEFHGAVDGVVVGYLVRNDKGLDVVGTNTFAEGVPIEGLGAGERVVVRSRLKLPVRAGVYTISPAVVDERNVQRADYFDWVDEALRFEVLPRGGRRIQGMCHVAQQLTIVRAPATTEAGPAG